MEKKSTIKTKRKVLGYALIGFYTLAVILLFVVLRPQTFSPIFLRIFPVPTPFIPPTPPLYPNNPQYINSSKKIAATIAPQISRDSIVGQLLHKIPYKGTYFQIFYYYQTAQYMVVINKDFASEGDTEFNTFLKNNGVEDRSWIRNLVVRYEAPFKFVKSTNVSTPSATITLKPNQ